ncbi:MAG: Gfo/Idh/MocA family oxidoreductase [Planctomycetes bacterium]|nr:Gfo/Idh/MocA family oxidoreductase [Planctomycetota bacterium]
MQRTRTTHRITRRRFIARGIAGGAGAGLALSLPAVAPARIAGANERLGVALIGCGGRGNHHLKVIAGIAAAGEAVQIVAACDVYRPRLERTAKAHGAKGYMDHRELLADARVDAVCIATPDHHHGHQAIDAVRAGKHVYCEKPLTHWRQIELMKRLAAEVARSGRAFQAGTQGLSDPAWHEAARLVKEGAIGPPIHAECGYFRVGDWGERGMPVDDPNARPGPDLDWKAFLGDSPEREFDVSRFFRWRMYMDYAGGPVTDLYPHTLTPVVRVLGVRFPSLVVATGGKLRYEEREVPDTFNMLIDYPEKVTVALLGTQGNDHPGTAHRGAGSRTPVVRGWEGTITFEGNEVVVRPVGGGSKPEKRVALPRGESEAEHWKDFLGCCRSGKAPRSPVDLGYSVQTALQMGMKSFLEGKAVRFEAGEERISA